MTSTTRNNFTTVRGGASAQKDTMKDNMTGVCSHLEDEHGEGDARLPQLCARHVERIDMRHRNRKTRRNRKPRRTTKTKEEEPSREEQKKHEGEENREERTDGGGQLRRGGGAGRKLQCGGHDGGGG